jgi:hypothetical protein
VTVASVTVTSPAEVSLQALTEPQPVLGPGRAAHAGPGGARTSLRFKFVTVTDGPNPGRAAESESRPNHPKKVTRPRPPAALLRPESRPGAAAHSKRARGL